MPSRDDAVQAGGFLSRWSRRKAAAQQGVALPEPAVPARPVAVPLPAGAVEPRRVDLPGSALPDVQADALPDAAPNPAPAAPAAESPPPTMDDVAALPVGADVRRFVVRGVEPEVRNAALKKLFADPHFNIMDGLDTYIDDYGKPDPLPEGMLRQMAQSKFLGLFADEGAEETAVAAVDAAATATATADAEPPPSPTASHVADHPAPPPDEDPALRLQPHTAAGPAAPAPGPGADPRRAG